MEWLKAILEKAEIKDGKLDVDAVMNAAQKEFPKYAVPKDDFNTKVEELKTANEQIVHSIETISAISEEVSAHANETMSAQEDNSDVLNKITDRMQQLIELTKQEA